MAQLHPAKLPIEELLRQCEGRHARRGGPGGQHRNKVETAMILRHSMSGVAAEANERRSLEENRQVAIQRLRIKLAIQVRSEELDVAISALWRNRARGGRIVVNPNHEDFPALLAEALDALAAAEYQTAEAAKRLGVSTTSLVGLIGRAPEALLQVNAVRESRGMPKLRSRA